MNGNINSREQEIWKLHLGEDLVLMPHLQDSITIKSFMGRVSSLKYLDQVFTKKRGTWQIDQRHSTSQETRTSNMQSSLTHQRRDSNQKGCRAYTMGQAHRHSLGQVLTSTQTIHSLRRVSTCRWSTHTLFELHLVSLYLDISKYNEFAIYAHFSILSFISIPLSIFHFKLKLNI